MDAVVLFSGGLDSAVLLAKALERNLKVLALSIDYRQRHIFELTCAEKLAKRFGVLWKKIALDPEVFEGVPLTGTSIVPPGMEGGVSKAYVPARNTLFLSYALGFAEKLGAREIHIGANAHDRTGFPDTHPDYL
ncbi:MAG: 7-cyano-7-deazaguanine synthase, partial [Chlamydiia bacterium]|nr:7-cyano-7-deazaguanine synthase [Chlamydiia bacterium]